MFETAAVILALIIAGVALIRRKPGFTPPATTAHDPAILTAFEARPSLFVNRSELAMFVALERAVPSSHRVMAKVRLEDIIGVKRGVTRQARWKLRGRVKSRHVDFLVTDMMGVPVLAIELDGASHDADAANADALKDALFGAVGLPLVRVRVGEDFARRAREISADLKLD